MNNHLRLALMIPEQATHFTKSTSMYAAAASECFSFVLAINISQKTDHHSKRNPPGASMAACQVRCQRLHCGISRNLKILSSILPLYQQGILYNPLSNYAYFIRVWLVQKERRHQIENIAPLEQLQPFKRVFVAKRYPETSHKPLFSVHSALMNVSSIHRISTCIITQMA